MLRQFNLKMEEANGAGEGAAAGGNAPNIADVGTGQSGTGQGTGGESGGQPGASSGDGKSWLDSLPEDLRKDPSLQLFKTPDALAKSYVNAQKLVGVDKVVIPNEKSTEEEVNAFYQKLGRPESADKYELKLPQGAQLDEGFAKSLKDIAFKSGLSGKQLNELANWYTGAAGEAVKASEAKELNTLRDSLNAYEQKVGGSEKMKLRMDQAKTAVRTLANDELKKFLVDSKLGSRPEMIEFFASLHGMMSEDKIRDGTGVSFQNEDPVVIQKQIDEIETKLFSEGTFGSANRDTWIDQRSKLYERLNAIRTKAS
jgi:hypothetical protein